MKKAIFIIIIVVLVGVFFYLNRNPVLNEEAYSGWLTATSTSSSLSFRYPENLGTTYVSVVDWPPMLNIYAGQYSCTPAGLSTDRAGRTEEKNINGTKYCVTQESEGAAGSTYNQYAYVFERGTGTAALTFTLRFPQCLNYEDPEKSQCSLEQQNLVLDTIVDKMVKSIK